MADTNGLVTEVATQATQPVSASADGQSATARSVGDMVRGVQFVAAAGAMKKRRRGILYAQYVPAGAAPDMGRCGDFTRPGGC